MIQLCLQKDRLAAWLLFPGIYKLTDLITAGCFICTCFARYSLKTSSKYLAIRKVGGEIHKHLIPEMWQSSCVSETLKLGTHNMLHQASSSSRRKNCEYQQCMQCVCIREWLPPIGTCTRIMSSSAL